MQPHPADAAMALWIWAGIAIVAAIIVLAALVDVYERRRRIRRTCNRQPQRGMPGAG